MKPIVLYVEDDLHSRMVMKTLLKEILKIPTVIVLDTSIDFPVRIDALLPKPNLIFLDVHVLPHNGYEMLEMLRAHPDYANAHIVALTASVMYDEIAKLKHAGFNGVIGKPIDQFAFPELLSRILEGEEIWQI